MAKAYADLGDLPENERIALIAQAAAAGNIVAVFVDDDAAFERYKKQLAPYPVRVIDRIKSPVPNTVAFRVGPRLN